jgi:hypothetical protein
MLGIALGVCGLLWNVFPVSSTQIGNVFKIALEQAIVGLLVGIMQWSVLRENKIGTWLWIAFTAISWGIFPLIFPMLDVIIIRGALGFSLIGLLVGTVAGLTQWIAMRRHFHRQAYWLILAGILGWAVALPLAFTGLGDLEDPIATIIINIVIGGITAVTTGVAFMWLLRHPIQQPDQSTQASV